MEQTWRWFGERDPIPLDHIRQAGATGIVTSLHAIPPGERWPVAAIEKRQAEIAAAGLSWSVCEFDSDARRDKAGRRGGEKGDRCLERRVGVIWAAPA